MIELHTGVPGSGKSLRMVQDLNTLQRSWEANPGEARPVFVMGIPDLLLPHSEVPLRSERIDKAGTVRLVPDWDEMPDGSLVIIDECQGIFPPRSGSTPAAPYIAWLNVHRHRGFDIWLTTQSPRLIDTGVRALVGRHKHFRRLFGMQRSIIYEWDACSDNLTGLANAVRTHWSFPTSAFKFYKSAELHTKQRFKLPLWLLLFPIGLALMAFFLPGAYNALTSSDKPAPAPRVASGPVPPGALSSSPGQSSSPFAGYFLLGRQCFGLRKTGDVVTEPDRCRENL